MQIQTSLVTQRELINQRMTKEDTMRELKQTETQIQNLLSKYPKDSKTDNT